MKALILSRSFRSDIRTGYFNRENLYDHIYFRNQKPEWFFRYCWAFT